MTTRKPRKPDPLTEAVKALYHSGIALATAQEAESWAGGGDPHEAPVLKAELEVAKARHEANLHKALHLLQDSQ